MTNEDTSWMGDDNLLPLKIEEMPKEEKLSHLSQLCIKQLELERQMAILEQRMEQLKEKHTKVANFEIPIMMKDIGMSEFKLTNGMKVSVTPFYKGKITDDKAYVWLIEHEHGDLIDAKLHIEYGAGDEYQIKRLARIMEENEIEYTETRGVHHMRLGALIREQAEAGTPVPKELFNVYEGVTTKIK